MDKEVKQKPKKRLVIIDNAKTFDNYGHNYIVIDYKTRLIDWFYNTEYYLTLRLHESTNLDKIIFNYEDDLNNEYLIITTEKGRIAIDKSGKILTKEEYDKLEKFYTPTEVFWEKK